MDSKEAETGLEGQELLPIKPFLFIVQLQLYADGEALFKQNPPFDSTLSWRHAIGRVPISSAAHFIFVQSALSSLSRVQTSGKGLGMSVVAFKTVSKILA